MMRAEPNACARKYFTAASVSCFVWERSINGMRERRFSSKAAHMIIRFLEEMDSRVLRIRAEVKQVLWGRRWRIIV